MDNTVEADQSGTVSYSWDPPTGYCGAVGSAGYHRTNGPSMITHQGEIEYSVEGDLHRETGPAFYWPKRGLVSYWVNDEGSSEKNMITRVLGSPDV